MKILINLSRRGLVSESMLRAVIKNTRILDGKSFVGIGLLGMLVSFKNNPDVFGALLFVVSIVLYVAYAFAINNCFDVDTDSLNPQKKHKNPIASGELSFEAGFFTSLAMILFGGMLAYFMSRPAFIIYAIMAVLATLYSAPPRLKSIPIADIFSHGLFFGALPFIYGAYFDGILSKAEMLVSVSLFMYSLAMELRNHLEDFESDQRAKLKTTPILLGKNNSEKLVNIFSVTSLVILLNSLYYPFGMFGILGVIGMNKKINYRIWDVAMTLTLAIYALKSIIGV